MKKIIAILLGTIATTLAGYGLYRLIKFIREEEPKSDFDEFEEFYS